MMRLALLLLVLAACSPQPAEAPAGSPPQRVQTTEAPEGDPRCWYGGCEGPFYSAAPARFGRFEVGEQILSIPEDAVTRSGDCADNAVMDCAFTLPDGVEYLVFERWIARKKMVLPTTHTLPFNLRGDESQEELVRRMGETLGIATSLETRDGRAWISHEGTLGTLENPMWLYFELDEAGRLSAITWQGPPTD